MKTRALAAIAMLVLAGCGGHGSAFGDGGTDGGKTGDSGFQFGDGSADGSGSYGCSGDLRNVIDGSGNVIKTCPPDQGCAGGACVAACQAAAASKGTVGCDYVVPTPSFYPGIAAPCFAIFVANNWAQAVNVTVSRGGQSYNVSSFGRIAQAGVPETSWAAVPSTGLPPGQVAVLFMSQDPSSSNVTPLTCPIAPAISQASGTAVADTARGVAWHLSSDVPVTMYDILPYGGAASYLPSAELLLPTTAWGTNYFGVVPQRGSQQPQWGQIVAYQANTQVTVFPNVALPSGTNVSAAPASTQTTYTLNAGEYVQWQDSMEMSGTVIQSNNPIGFFGGLGYDCYSDSTSSGGGCDSAHQQVPPVAAYGSEYAVPPYTTRRADLQPESILYRFVGAVSGTTLTYDPPVTSAPNTLSEGQVIDFETPLAFVVKSQDNAHPFFVGQVMTGCMVTSGSRPGCSAAAIAQFGSCCLGDEEYVNILPPAQFLQKYVFFTDPTYPTTNLVFTRVKGPNGFADVSLDCLPSPITGWTNVGSGGIYQVANVDLIRGETKNGTCDNGPHVVTSNGAFGVMVWGLDTYSSYAYPAGGNVAPINTVVVPPTPH